MRQVHVLRQFRHYFTVFRKRLECICHLRKRHCFSFILLIKSRGVGIYHFTNTSTENLNDIGNMLGTELDPKHVIVIEQHILIHNLHGTVVRLECFRFIRDFIVFHGKQVIDHGLVGKVVHEWRKTIVLSIEEQESTASTICMTRISMIPPAIIVSKEFVHFEVKCPRQGTARGRLVGIANMRILIECHTHRNELVSNIGFNLSCVTKI
mmetsp:Transcript_12354/g.22451  ORF Transcript_12354/g.22451 Transcript_12354/m.22451 type:complete len:209 (+) Transcript_12354:884-1510(+)